MNLTDTLDFADFAIGSVYICCFLAFTAVYFFVLVTVSSDIALMKQSCYQILIATGLADVVQLFFIGFVAAILCLNNDDFGFWFNKICGAILNSFWISYTALCSLLAINRLLLVKVQYSMKNSCLWIFVCYLYGFLYFIAYLCPTVDFKYELEDHVWYYSQAFASMIVLYIEMANDTLQALIISGCYTVTCLELYKMRKNSSQNKLKSAEIDAFVHSLTVCVMLICYVILWFGLPKIFHSAWADLSINIFWILMLGKD